MISVCPSEMFLVLYVIIDYGQMLLTFLCGIHTFLLMLYSPMINFDLAKTILRWVVLIKGESTFGLNSKFTFLFHLIKENYSLCNIIFKNRWQQIHDSKYLPHGYEKIELIRIVGNVYSHNFQEIKEIMVTYFLNQLMDNQVHTSSH